MSSPLSPTPASAWSSMAPYVIDPLAAGVAVVPFFPGFAAKSALQAGEKIPRLGFLGGLRGALKAAPTIGIIVGTQMKVQNVVEGVLIKTPEDKNAFAPMVLSSAFVGLVSAPALAIFNAQTMRKTMKEALTLLLQNPKQTGAIVVREIFFVLSLRFSGPLGEKMKESFGDKKTVEYASAFLSGAIGSLAGHPADTALTLWQKGMKISTVRSLGRGWHVRAVTVGGFSTLYKVSKEFFESSAK